MYCCSGSITVVTVDKHKNKKKVCKDGRMEHLVTLIPAPCNPLAINVKPQIISSLINTAYIYTQHFTILRLFLGFAFDE